MLRDASFHHLLLGHHGWFSLTPVWFLALGTLIGLGIRSAEDVKKLFRQQSGTGWTPEMFAAMTLGIGVNCAIQLLEGYDLARAVGASSGEALQRALTLTGPPALTLASDTKSLVLPSRLNPYL